jgi:hypothetical protein
VARKAAAPAKSSKVVARTSIPAKSANGVAKTASVKSA